jgi:hypothetical protein
MLCFHGVRGPLESKWSPHPTIVTDFAIALFRGIGLRKNQCNSCDYKYLGGHRMRSAVVAKFGSTLPREGACSARATISARDLRVQTSCPVHTYRGKPYRYSTKAALTSRSTVFAGPAPSARRVVLENSRHTVSESQHHPLMWIGYRVLRSHALRITVCAGVVPSAGVRR